MHHKRGITVLNWVIASGNESKPFKSYKDHWKNLDSMPKVIMDCNLITEIKLQPF